MDHNNGCERRHTSVFKITTTWLAILPFVNNGIIAVHYVCTRPTSHQTPIQIFKTPQVMHLPTLYYVYTRPASHQIPIQILKFHKSCICQLCNCALCIHKAHFLPDASANFKNYTSSVWYSNHLFFEFESYCQETWSPGKQSNFFQNKF